MVKQIALAVAFIIMIAVSGCLEAHSADSLPGESPPVKQVTTTAETITPEVRTTPEVGMTPVQTYSGESTAITIPSYYAGYCEVMHANIDDQSPIINPENTNRYTLEESDYAHDIFETNEGLVRVDDFGPITARSFIYFDTSKVPSGVKIVSAEMVVYVVNKRIRSGDENMSGDENIYLAVDPTGQHPMYPLNVKDYNLVYYNKTLIGETTFSAITVPSWHNFTIFDTKYISRTGDTRIVFLREREIGPFEVPAKNWSPEMGKYGGVDALSLNLGGNAPYRWEQGLTPYLIIHYI